MTVSLQCVGIGLSQQRLTCSLEHTPSLGKVDAVEFALPGRRTKGAVQGERRRVVLSFKRSI